LLLIAGAVESLAERLQRIERIVRARCVGFLTAEDLDAVLKPRPKPEGPEIRRDVRVRTGRTGGAAG
jgi:hypothetical protein